MQSPLQQVATLLQGGDVAIHRATMITQNGAEKSARSHTPTHTHTHAVDGASVSSPRVAGHSTASVAAADDTNPRKPAADVAASIAPAASASTSARACVCVCDSVCGSERDPERAVAHASTCPPAAPDSTTSHTQYGVTHSHVRPQQRAWCGIVTVRVRVCACDWAITRLRTRPYTLHAHAGTQRDVKGQVLTQARDGAQGNTPAEALTRALLRALTHTHTHTHTGDGRQACVRWVVLPTSTHEQALAYVFSPSHERMTGALQALEAAGVELVRRGRTRSLTPHLDVLAPVRDAIPSTLQEDRSEDLPEAVRFGFVHMLVSEAARQLCWYRAHSGVADDAAACTAAETEPPSCVGVWGVWEANSGQSRRRAAATEESLESIVITVAAVQPPNLADATLALPTSLDVISVQTDDALAFAGRRARDSVLVLAAPRQTAPSGSTVDSMTDVVPSLAKRSTANTPVYGLAPPAGPMVTPLQQMDVSMEMQPGYKRPRLVSDASAPVDDSARTALTSPATSATAVARTGGTTPLHSSVLSILMGAQSRPQQRSTVKVATLPSSMSASTQATADGDTHNLANPVARTTTNESGAFFLPASSSSRARRTSASGLAFRGLAAVPSAETTVSTATEVAVVVDGDEHLSAMHTDRETGTEIDTGAVMDEFSGLQGDETAALLAQSPLAVMVLRATSAVTVPVLQLSAPDSAAAPSAVDAQQVPPPSSPIAPVPASPPTPSARERMLLPGVIAIPRRATSAPSAAPPPAMPVPPIVAESVVVTSAPAPLVDIQGQSRGSTQPIASQVLSAPKPQSSSQSRTWPLAHMSLVHAGGRAALSLKVLGSYQLWDSTSSGDATTSPILLHDAACGKTGLWVRSREPCTYIHTRQQVHDFYALPAQAALRADAASPQPLHMNEALQLTPPHDPASPPRASRQLPGAGVRTHVDAEEARDGAAASPAKPLRALTEQKLDVVVCLRATLQEWGLVSLVAVRDA